MTVVVLVALSVVGTRADDRPNIVFILADDVGCEPLGCYGGQSWPTPHIDRLAAGGLRFDHCYSMPVCHPTRVCLLTGRYPMHVGDPAWGSFPRQLEGHTLAHVLRQAGYATAVAGKWQLCLLGKDLDHPYRLGFQEYCLFGWHEGGRYHHPLIWQNGSQRTDTRGKYGPDIYVDFLIEFMKRHRERPFFLFYSMALCHDVTDDLDQPVAYVPGKDRYLNYGEMIASMDACVGRVVQAIDELELRERTVIFFTGDNGTAVRSIIRAEPRQPDEWTYVRDPVVSRVNGKDVPGGKGSLTDGGTHVPLIVNWKSTIPRGTTTDTLVDFSDFLPTLADLGKTTVPLDVETDGHSFAMQWRDEDPRERRKWAFSQGRRGKFWVRDQTWKLYNDGSLFDLANDPAERKPLRPDVESPPARDARNRLLQAINSL